MLVELLKEQQLDGYLNYYNRDKKKFRYFRVTYGGIIFLIFTMGALVVEKHAALLGTPIAFFVGYKIPYLNLMLKKKKSDLMNSFLFPQFLQSFIALISTSGNVYQTLKATIDYTSEPLKGKLEKLVRNIEDRNNREDYIAFAEYVGSSEAYMIMDMIYQFSEFGIKKDALQELQNYIQSIQENKTDELITSKMNQMDILGFIPIIIFINLIGGYAAVILWHYMKDVMDALSVL